MTKPQYYPMTITSAIAHYQKGDLTAKGLLHLYFRIRMKDGWTLKETQKEITDKLGISRAAFYSAISKLKAEGSINWSAPANTKFSFSLNCLDSDSTIEDALSTVEDTLSTVEDTLSTIVDSQSTIVDRQSFIVTREKLEAKQVKGSGLSSDFFSNSFSDYLSTLSHSERESFEKFCFKKVDECSFKIASPKAWLDKHHREYWEEFSRKYPEAAGVEKSSGISPSVENQLTPAYLQQMYGAAWKEAAAHFGIEIAEEVEW